VTSLASVPVTLWSNRAPVAENWQHKAIIEKILELKKKVAFVRVVTLTNHPELHSNTLSLSAEMMGAADVSFSGPSKNRWLDFKDFILTKTGNLGPVETIGTVKPDADLVLNPPDWFKKSYRQAGRWPLPDGSDAILFKADPQPVKAIGAGALQLSLGKFSVGKIDFTNVEVRAETLSEKDTALGRFKELRVRASEIRSNDLSFKNPDIKLIRPQVNMPRLLETGEIQIISAEALEPRLELEGDLITSYAARKIKGLSDPRVKFEGSQAQLQAIYHGIPIEIVFAYLLEANSLTIRLQKAKAGFLRLPNILFVGLTDRVLSLQPNDEIPFELKLKSLVGAGTRLKVGS
jgi:hypothetical protein